MEVLRCSDISSETTIGFKFPAIMSFTQINFERLCNCSCEDHPNNNTALCRGRGSETCGKCYCNPPYFGKTCECSTDQQYVLSYLFINSFSLFLLLFIFITIIVMRRAQNLIMINVYSLELTKNVMRRVPVTVAYVAVTHHTAQIIVNAMILYAKIRGIVQTMDNVNVTNASVTKVGRTVRTECVNVLRVIMHV